MTNPTTTDRVDAASLSQYDMIIDVRSPGEFAEDHVPGAVNLPVLDNDERSIIGATYVQTSRFLARRMGAAMVARNVARHLDTALADRSADFKPLIYCWRGGQRSNSMATILAQVGWRTSVLQGGYKTYRQAVRQRLYEDTLGLRLVLIDGGTGCAKTAILTRLGALGAQIIDLESLAQHRGSLFGALEGGQPSQKGFESSLLDGIERLDRKRVVFVEAESNKIGSRTLPPSLWRAMVGAPRIVVTAPIDARAAYLAEAYPEIIADRQRLEAALSRLEVYPGRKQLASWRLLADAGEYHELIRAVVERHYDPAYTRFSRNDARRSLGTLALSALDGASLAAAARDLLKMAGDGAGPA